MKPRKNASRLAALAWCGLAAWVVGIALNATWIVGAWRLSFEALTKHVPGALGGLAQALIVTLIPWGSASALGYVPILWLQGVRPDFVFWPVAALAPLALMWLYWALTGIGRFRDLLAVSLPLAVSLVFASAIGVGTDSILVLLGPGSRVSDLSVLGGLTFAKMLLVGPYALLWVGIAAPGIVSAYSRWRDHAGHKQASDPDAEPI